VRYFLFVLVVLVLAACGGNDPTPQPTPNPEPIPSTPEPEPNPNPVPTPDPEPEPTPEPETTPPNIVSVRLESARDRLTLLPGQAQRGVDKDTNIVITFSEAMNEAVTEASFQSDNAGLNDVTFAWDETSTVLTIDPRASLEYTAPRKQYNFSLEGTASDLTGNPLAGESSFIFFTLQQSNKTMPAVLSLEGSLRRRSDTATKDITKDPKLFVGDNENDIEGGSFTDHSFLTFDLSTLRSNVANEDVLSARLSVSEIGLKGTPFDELGTLQLEHVVYGSSLEASDFDAEVLSLISSFVATDNVAGTFSTLDSESLLAAVREDRELTERGKRGQFRLRFQFDGSSDDRIDAIQFASSDNIDTSRRPTLEVTFLEP
jgi:hypothetical protein